MIVPMVCFLAFADQQAVGQKWQYDVMWHFSNKELNLTDEESLEVEVTKVRSDSTTIKVSQKLVASIFDGQRVPTDPKAVPSAHEWALSPTGSVAFMPVARFGLESRVYRILKGILPEPKGDPSRSTAWEIMFAEDGQGMPEGKLKAAFVDSTKEGMNFKVRYREDGGTTGLGKFTRKEKMPFPSQLEMHFTNTRMSGGTDVVDCDFSMTLKPKKPA